MITQIIRYLPVIRFIERHNITKICEIGSGSYGIGKFKKIHFVGADINFDDYGKTNFKDKNTLMNRVLLYKNRNLPFKSDSFNFVFSIDTFEHLDKKRRKLFISEMLRVSNQYVFISFPAGHLSFILDALFFNLHKLFHLSSPKWLEEHIQMQYPKTDELDLLLKKKNIAFEKFFNEGYLYHLFFSIVEKFNKLSSLSGNVSKNKFFKALLFKKRPFGYRVCYLIRKTKKQ